MTAVNIDLSRESTGAWLVVPCRSACLLFLGGTPRVFIEGIAVPWNRTGTTWEKDGLPAIRRDAAATAELAANVAMPLLVDHGRCVQVRKGVVPVTVSSSDGLATRGLAHAQAVLVWPAELDQTEGVCDAGLDLNPALVVTEIWLFPFYFVDRLSLVFSMGDCPTWKMSVNQAWNETEEMAGCLAPLGASMADVHRLDDLVSTACRQWMAENGPGVIRGIGEAGAALIDSFLKRNGYSWIAMDRSRLAESCPGWLRVRGVLDAPCGEGQAFVGALTWS